MISREAVLSASLLTRRCRQQFPWAILTIVVCILILTPILTLQQLTFENGGAGLRQLLNSNETLKILTDTAILAVGALFVALVSGSMLAFCVYTLPASTRRYTAFIPVLPLLIPSVAHAISFVFLFSPDNGYANTLIRTLPFASQMRTGPFNIYTFTGIIIYTGLHLSSYVYLFVYTGLINLGDDYAQAARANGSSSARTLLEITIPLLRPVFVYASLVVLLLSLGQFSGPLVLGRREGITVVTTEIYRLTNEFPVNYPLGAAYGMPILVIALCLVWVQRKLIGNHDRFIGRGQTSNAVSLPKPIWTNLLAVFVICLFVGISAILPIVSLIFVSLSPYWSGYISVHTLTIKNILYVIYDPIISKSLLTTLYLAFISIVIVIPLGMIVSIAIFSTRQLSRPLAVTLDVVSSLPLAVPSAVLGFGFLFVYGAMPFGLYGSPVGLIVAFVVIELPFAVRYQLATLIAITPGSIEAARANGSSFTRTFIFIILPLTRSGIGAAAAVIFVLLVHEFGVALMLRSPDSNVMSVVLYDLYNSGGLYPRVAAMALLMTFVTMIGVMVAIWAAGVKAFERI